MHIKKETLVITPQMLRTLFDFVRFSQLLLDVCCVRPLSVTFPGTRRSSVMTRLTDSPEPADS